MFAERFPVRTPVVCPQVDIRHEHAGASYMLESGPESSQGVLHDLQAADRLGVAVVRRMNGAVGVDRCGARYEDPLIGAERPAVPDLGLPVSPAEHTLERQLLPLW